MEIGCIIDEWETILMNHGFIFELPCPSMAEWNFFDDEYLTENEIFFQHLSMRIENVLYLFTLLTSEKHKMKWSGHSERFNQCLLSAMAFGVVVPFIVISTQKNEMFQSIALFDRLPLAFETFALLKDGLIFELASGELNDLIKDMVVGCVNQLIS